VKIERLLPKNQEYPTGQQVRVAAIQREMRKRIRSINREAQAWIERQPVQVVTNATSYQYQLDPLRISAMKDWLRQLINRDLFGNLEGIWSPGWWLNAHMSGVVQQGTQAALTNAQLITTAEAGDVSQVIKAMTIEQVLSEQGYQRRLQGTFGRVFESMSGLADWMKNDLAGVLTRGMAAGINARAIAKSIAKRIPVSDSRALRIARTETNTAYTKAHTAETDELNSTVYSDSPWVVKVMHLSALAPNTRLDHGRRHGTIATTQEQNYWWDNVAVGGRISCQCSVADVLVHRETDEVMQAGMVKIAKAQRKEYFG